MKKKVINNLFIMGFVFYALFVLWNILFKYSSPFELFSSNREYSRTINLIPFNDILNGYLNRMDIFGNVILFIPLGIYVNLIGINSKLSKNIYKIISISLMFELIQYVFGLGASDITDIITNTIGGLMGIGIYMLINKIFNDKIKVKNFVTICSTILMLFVGVLIIGLFLYN